MSHFLVDIHRLTASRKFKVKEVVAKEVQIIDPKNQVTVGETNVLSVKILPDNTTYKDVEWKVADETIVEVTGEGVLHALSTGITTITAIVGDVWDYSAVRVFPSVERIVIEDGKDIIRIPKGGTHELKIDIYPLGILDKGITIDAGSPDVIMMHGDTIEAIGVGKCVVTLEAGNGVRTSIVVRVFSYILFCIGGAVSSLHLWGCGIGRRGEVNKAYDTVIDVLFR